MLKLVVCESLIPIRRLFFRTDRSTDRLAGMGLKLACWSLSSLRFSTGKPHCRDTTFWDAVEV